MNAADLQFFVERVAIDRCEHEAATYLTDRQNRADEAPRLERESPLGEMLEMRWAKVDSWA